MHRIDAPGHVSNRFRAGNPFLGVAGTVVDSAWLNAVQDELTFAIEDAGLPLSKTSRTQLRDAILLHAGTSGGQLEAVTNAPLVTPASAMRPELTSAVVLASRGHQDNPNAGIYAGFTSGPPTSSNTIKANGYTGGVGNEMDGHFWPYQAPLGAQMQGDASVNDGWFPACLDGQGINHYWYPDWITPPGMMGKKGGGFAIDLFGSTQIPAASGTFHIELVLGRNSYGAWNSGNGGETSNAGTFSGNRAFSLLSPPMTRPGFSSLALQTRIRVEVVSFYKRTLTAFATWQMVDSFGTEAMNAVTATSWSGAGTVKFQPTFSRWKLLLKIDKDNGAGTFPPLTVNNVPFGSPGVPPLAVQDGTACYFRNDFASVTSIPNGG